MLKNPLEAGEIDGGPVRREYYVKEFVKKMHKQLEFVKCG